MLTIDKYDNLSEIETRKALCDDIFLYFKDVILKYKERFLILMLLFLSHCLKKGLRK